MNSPPIFIHSLFRSGSTYIFNVFRRSDVGYWCYQESMHEMAAFAKEKPNDLISGFGDLEVKNNRHPKLDKPYFLELFEASPTWKDKIHEKLVYDAYFSEKKSEVGIEFWQSLIEAAKGWPVFQECRTSGRIKAIKKYLEGFHVFLWRNPWDQWWSYKINAYFNTANQLIVHADNVPAPIKCMLAALGLPRCEDNDLEKAFLFYNDRPLTSEQSYLVFYMLWCLSLKEGVDNADLTVNIDRLSESVEYQDQILESLTQVGIGGVSLSDCHVPQGVYSETDEVFFKAAEARVHLWLLEGGWRHSDIKTIQSLRNQFAPLSWSIPIAKQEPLRLVEQSERFKEMAKRFETSLAEHQRASLSKLRESTEKSERAERTAHQLAARETEIQNQLTTVLHTLEQSQAQMHDALKVAQQAQELNQYAEARASKAEELTQHAEARARKAEILKQETNEKLDSQSRELEMANQELHRVHQANHHHWQLSEQRWQELHAVYNSKSWRITAPLRWPVQQLRLLHEYGLKNRLKAFVKKVLRRLNRFLLARPKLRHRLVRLSQFLGIYNTLKRFGDRLREHPNGRAMHKANGNGFAGCPEQMTPHTQQIYVALNQLLEQQKGAK